MLFVTIIVLFVLRVTSAQNLNNYTLPNVTVQALKPIGFRIYIPGDPRIKIFHFEANFYLSNLAFYKSIREFVVEETNGYWLYEDRETPLKVGDIVVYYIFVGVKRGATDIVRWLLKVPGYTANGKRKITEEDVIDDKNLLEPYDTFNETCKTTVTKLINGKACSGQVIFEDHFDNFREDLWQIGQYIPKDDPYHPFVIYKNEPSNPTVFIKNGVLNIKPKLTKNINESMLNSPNGCINQLCDNFGLLPVIESGKLIAKIPFTYGLVEIRAKMPIGDWLYPEMHLESFTNKYGKVNYASGVLRIATIFGNNDLNDTYNNKFLGGSALLNTACFTILERKKKISSGTWSDDFHVFSLKWTPDVIEQYVDGEMWNRFKPGRNGLRSWLPLSCRKDWFELLGTGDKMAPFDHYFQLSLGMAAGGMMFPDNLVGTVTAKPWRNKDRKAIQQFWNDRQNWYSTWTQPLLIDYVKISAL